MRASFKASSLSVLRLTLDPALASRKTQAGVFVGGADESFEAKRLSQIVDPTGGTACLHDNEVDLVFFEDRLEVVAIGGCVKELVLSGF